MTNYKSPMEKAVEKKQYGIEKFQATKEDSIKRAGIQRDTTLIVTTFYPEFATAENKEERIIEKLIEWRETIKDIFDQPF